MVKLANIGQLSFEITDAEKEQANKALDCFERTDKLLDAASTHLDIMLTPFKDYPDIAPEQVLKFRAAIRRFRDKAIENFNIFKQSAFQCITLMQMFSSDTQTLKLMKSFVSSIEKIEDYVNSFSKLFDNLEDKDFVSNITKSITSIKKEIEQLDEIIDDRIKTHLRNNILGKNWVEDMGKKLELNVQKETPLLINLFKQRQDALNEGNR